MAGDAAVVMFGAVGTIVGITLGTKPDQISTAPIGDPRADTSTTATTLATTTTAFTTTTSLALFTGVPGGNPSASPPFNVGPDPEVAAKAELDRLVDADRPAANSLILDQWVPQVSAKKAGVLDKANGRTYTWQTSLQDYRDWKSRYADALLLLSSEYSTFAADGFYITVVPRTFGSGPAATSWCRSEGLAVPDRCLGKIVSKTRGTSGTTQTS